MSTFHLVLISLAFLAHLVQAQDKWVWSKGRNQKVLGYYPSANKKIYYADNEPYARADRDREPTTKRPLPGEVANDDIDDYADDSDASPPTRQNSPYLPGGLGGSGFGGAVPGFGGQPGFGVQPGFGIQPGGFNQYPQFGAAGGAGGYPAAANPNGILVGPGGPTGVIGRPQTAYPSNYPGQVGYPGYPAYNTQNFAASANPGFAAGVASQYPQQQFPGGLGQYPGAQPYPQGSHQFTEGYGLSPYAQPNPTLPQHSFSNGYPSYGNYPAGGGGGGYPGFQDEYVPQIRAKSANVKANEKKIDDKVSKTLKNS